MDDGAARSLGGDARRGRRREWLVVLPRAHGTGGVLHDIAGTPGIMDFEPQYATQSYGCRLAESVVARRRMAEVPLTGVGSLLQVSGQRSEVQPVSTDASQGAKNLVRPMRRFTTASSRVIEAVTVDARIGCKTGLERIWGGDRPDFLACPPPFRLERRGPTQGRMRAASISSQSRLDTRSEMVSPARRVLFSEKRAVSRSGDSYTSTTLSRRLTIVSYGDSSDWAEAGVPVRLDASSAQIARRTASLADYHDTMKVTADTPASMPPVTSRPFVSAA